MDIIEIVTPPGRMVQGHPMIMNLQRDTQGQPKKTQTGEDFHQCFVGLAIPKGGEQHWNQTEWGAKIYNAGVQAFPRGEANSPHFAWKITDGDSAIPNTKGIAPNTREGFPGHWVVGATNGFQPNCYAKGDYSTPIMRPEFFKTGDYVRLVITVKGNQSQQSPGVYINLEGCEMIQAGPEIKSEGAFNAQATFGAVAAQPMSNMLPDPNVGQPAQAAPQGYPQAAPAQAAPQGYPQSPPSQAPAGAQPMTTSPSSGQYPTQAHNFLPGQGQ